MVLFEARAVTSLRFHFPTPGPVVASARFPPQSIPAGPLFVPMQTREAFGTAS